MSVSYDYNQIQDLKWSLQAAFSCPCHSMQVPLGFPWGTVIVSTTLSATSEELSQEITKIFSDTKGGYLITPVQVHGTKATSKMTAKIYIMDGEMQGPNAESIHQIAKAIKEVCLLYNTRWNKSCFAHDGHELSSHFISSSKQMTMPDTSSGLDKSNADPLKVTAIYTTV